MSNERVLLWSAPISRAAVESELKKLPGVDLVSVASADDAIAQMASADVAVLPVFNYTPALANAVRASARLRFLQLLTIGYDRLLTDKPQDSLSIASAGDSLSPAVAEHAVALMLALGRRIHEAQTNAAQQKWDSTQNTRMFSLDGKTIAIVGFGAIGKEAALRLRPFGAHVIGISRTAAPSDLADEVAPASELDAILPRADIVMLSTPLTDATRRLFDASRIARMKKGAVLINIARGQIVDTHAMVEALQSGQLGGAGLDVTDPEPIPADHPLWRAPNAIVTPHVAAAGGYRRLGLFAAANVAAFLRGETPKALIER